MNIKIGIVFKNQPRSSDQVRLFFFQGSMFIKVLRLNDSRERNVEMIKSGYLACLIQVRALNVSIMSLSLGNIREKYLSKPKKLALLALHLAVLAASVVMIIWITRETINNISFLASPGYMRFQFWVCLLFMFDIAVDWTVSPNKWRYFVSNIFFIIISIPWLNIIQWLHIDMSAEMAYLMKFVPMIRAGYVLALVSGALSANKALSMMAVYIIWVIASVYFGSLMFFVEEHYINPLVTSWWDSLWWAALNITTVGCEISPYTATGKILAIILSGEGLMLFPVFTVYVTNSLADSPDTSDTPDTPDSSSQSA